MAANHLSHQMTSAVTVLRLGLNPLWLGSRYLLTQSAILNSTIRESALRIVDSSTMGRTLVSGPFGLPGFCRGI